MTSMALIRIACLILMLCGCQGSDTDPARPPTVIDPELIHTLDFQPPDSTDSEGRRLAKLYCQSCHIFAEPDLLDQTTLREWVLPILAKILGLPSELAGLPPKKHQRGGRAVGHLSPRAVDPRGGLVPIVEYYLQAAPEQLLPQDARTVIGRGLGQFDVLIPEYRVESPFTTLVMINEGRIYAGDSHERSLVILDGQGQLVQKVRLNLTPTDIDWREGTIWVTSIGSPFPSDDPQGQLMAVAKEGDTFLSVGNRVLRDLSRPVATSFADLDGDGVEEIVVSEFGNRLGHLSYFIAKEDGGHEERWLNQYPGGHQPLRARLQWRRPPGTLSL